MAVVVHGVTTRRTFSSTQIVADYPAGIASGDVLVLVVTVPDDQATWDAPTGWTISIDDRGNVGNSQRSAAVYLRTADGNESGSIFIPVSGMTNAQHNEAGIYRTSGGVAGIRNSVGDSGFVTVHPVPSVLVARTGAVLLAGINSNRNEDVTFSDPGMVTPARQRFTSLTYGEVGTGVYQGQTVTTQGATNAWTFSMVIEPEEDQGPGTAQFTPVGLSMGFVFGDVSGTSRHAVFEPVGLSMPFVFSNVTGVGEFVPGDAFFEPEPFSWQYRYRRPFLPVDLSMPFVFGPVSATGGTVVFQPEPLVMRFFISSPQGFVDVDGAAQFRVTAYWDDHALRAEWQDHAARAEWRPVEQESAVWVEQRTETAFWRLA